MTMLGAGLTILVIAASAWGGVPEVRLKECSRWPERGGCGQDCLIQVEG
jgi:hypothetical protein